ncbi:MAG: peptidoglycan N-acetylglucosamine deacetylase, partial [Lachnospiraceae bacterium]|nr:peptidoglycan N-acetylglucosamine deacetylase [Lachnospiraceae bacterium]
KENAIILLHDYYQTSIEAALRIVDELQKEGYEFVTVDQVLLE